MDLYIYVPPLGSNIPISVDPFQVVDSVPTKEDIEWVVKIIRNYRSGGASGMRSKHLKGWLAAAIKKEREEAAAEQENPSETTALSDRTEGEETEDSREKTPTEDPNWERVAELVQTEFGEGRLA